MLRCSALTATPHLIIALTISPALAVLLSPQNSGSTSVVGACDLEIKAKKFDVVVFGATGIVGQLASQYLARHPAKPTFLLAGRNQAKLHQLHSRIIGNKSMPFERAVSSSPGPEVRIANLNTYDSLLAIAREAKVVLTFASPYDEHGGEQMIKAAMESCSHYVDISAETVWRANMMKKFGPMAAERGLAIVQAAGLSLSMLADLLAMAAAKDMVKDGQGPPTSIFLKYKKMNGIPGGTAISSARYAIQKYGEVKNPYIFTPETPIDKRVDEELDGMQHPVAQNIPGLMWYPSARMDCLIVRRSLHMEFPNATISVRQAQTIELDKEIKDYVLKGPYFEKPTQIGESPPKWEMSRGSFDCEGVARRKGDGKSTRVIVEGQGDPGYLGSSRASAELALGLAQSGPAGGIGGYLTPVTALGNEALEARLTAADGGTFLKVTHET